MALTYQNYDYGADGVTSLSSASISYTAGQPIVVACGSGDNAPTISDTAGLTWTLLGRQASTSWYTASQSVWVATPGSSGSTVITVSAASTSMTMRVITHTGAGTPILLATGEKDNSGGTTVISQAVTPTTSGSALWMFMADWQEQVIPPVTAGSGCTWEQIASTGSAYSRSGGALRPTTQPLTSNASFTLSATPDSSAVLEWVAIEVPSGEVPGPPTIDTDPVSRAGNLGGTATFSATVTQHSGTGLSLQWQVSTDSGSTWSPISGALSSSYTTGALTGAETGYQYRLVATDSNGSATSAAATLTAVITSWPALSAMGETAIGEIAWVEDSDVAGAGSASIAMTAAGAPSVTRALGGSASVSLVAAGSGAATRTGAGTASVAVTAAGSAAASRSLAGSAAVSVVTSGTGDVSKPLAGSAALALTGAGAGLAARVGAGAASLAFAAAADGATSDAPVSHSGAGSAGILVTVSAAGAATRTLSGGADVGVTAAASAGVSRTLSGSAAASIDSTGSAGVSRAGAGTAQIDTSTSGSASVARVLAGGAMVTVHPAAAGAVSWLAAGEALLAFTASGTLVLTPANVSREVWRGSSAIAREVFAPSPITRAVQASSTVTRVVRAVSPVQLEEIT